MSVGLVQLLPVLLMTLSPEPHTARRASQGQENHT